MVEVESFAPVHTEGVVRLCAAEGWRSWTQENTARGLTAPGVIAVVAVQGSELVGVAQLLTDGEVTAYLALLVVAEKARGRNVGRALIRELFARSGLERIDLLAEQCSVPFYESMAHRAKPGYRLYTDP